MSLRFGFAVLIVSRAGVRMRLGMRVGRYTAFVQASWGIWVLAWHGFSLDSCTHDLHAGSSGLLVSR